MENLKSVLANLIEQTKPYWIVGASCFVAGILIGALL